MSVVGSLTQTTYSRVGGFLCSTYKKDWQCRETSSSETLTNHAPMVCRCPEAPTVYSSHAVAGLAARNASTPCVMIACSTCLSASNSQSVHLTTLNPSMYGSTITFPVDVSRLKPILSKLFLGTLAPGFVTMHSYFAKTVK